MLVVLLTIGMALMTISQVRQWGVSLLAAGGAAGIFLGLALRPLLSNLMAGLQIATTQPIRREDQVVVENEVGNVEEITATYVVVRLWDERRMVLPLTYFLQKPFQNWTRDSAKLIGAVMLYVDYTTPAEPLRAKLNEILKASPLWDGRVVALQVTDARERTMEIRCLMSAANAGQLFDLRCVVREAMIVYLRESFPNARRSTGWNWRFRTAGGKKPPRRANRSGSRVREPRPSRDGRRSGSDYFAALSLAWMALARSRCSWTMGAALAAAALRPALSPFSE